MKSDFVEYLDFFLLIFIIMILIVMIIGIYWMYMRALYYLSVYYLYVDEWHTMQAEFRATNEFIRTQFENINEKIDKISELK